MHNNEPYERHHLQSAPREHSAFFPLSFSLLVSFPDEKARICVPHPGTTLRPLSGRRGGRWGSFFFSSFLSGSRLERDSGRGISQFVTVGCAKRDFNVTQTASPFPCFSFLFSSSSCPPRRGFRPRRCALRLPRAGC